jgi:NPCBM/NEW2 domain
MNGLSLFVLFAIGQAPTVEVQTLSERQLQGTLESLNTNSVILKTSSGSETVPVTEILQIQTAFAAASTVVESIVVRLVDNSQLKVRTFLSSGTVVTVTHPQLGELRIPATSVSSVRFAAADSRVDTEWNQLIERAPKKDMIAIRKGDVLDHLDGVVGTMNDATLQFQLDGDNLAVKREKIFGLIYSKRELSAKKAVAQLELTSGDRLSARQIEWNGTKWQVRLVTGLELGVAPESLKMIDYSISKFTYLSDLEPRGMKHTPYFGEFSEFHVFACRRDKDFEGNRIALGHKRYAKGLAIHSKTALKYRLGGDYRRFQAVMGIGDEINRGNVDVTIKADEKIVFNGSVKVGENSSQGSHRPAPQLLDIDVAGVVELEIVVDYGSDKIDIGDRLYLANARFVR